MKTLLTAVFSLFFVAVTPAQSWKWIERLTVIYEKSEEIDQALEFIEYAEGVRDDIQSGRQPRKPPVSMLRGNACIKKLEEIASELSKIVPLELPEDAPGFTIPNLIQGSQSDRANSLAEAVKFWEIRQEHLRLLGNQVSMLKLYGLRAQAVSAAARATADQIKKVMETSILPDIYNLLGLLWLDLETQILPALAKITQLGEKKILEVEKELALRTQEEKNLHANLSMLVQNLLDELTSERDKLVKEANAHSGDSKKYEADLVDFEKRLPALRALQGELANREKAVSAETSALNSKCERYNAEVEALKKLQEEINTPFKGCPNGNDFDNCTHEDIKAWWTYAINQKLNEYSKRQPACRALGEEVDRETKALEQKTSALRLDNESAQREAAELMSLRKRLDSERFRLVEGDSELRTRLRTVLTLIQKVSEIKTYLGN